MPVSRLTAWALFALALILVGCRGGGDPCVQASIAADPEEMPPGFSSAEVLVEIVTAAEDDEPNVRTELRSSEGVFADPSAHQTTFTCFHDIVGPAELCVDAWVPADPSSSDGLATAVDGCIATECTAVTCPEVKNMCPVIDKLIVEPEVLTNAESATISVVAGDADGVPEPLSTIIFAKHGTIADPTAAETTYECDPTESGFIPVCVAASDGDPACDVERCTAVECIGDPPGNTCPIIQAFTADPVLIPLGEAETTVTIDAVDPDGDPLSSRLTAEIGAFDDPLALETVFICGEPGPVQLCANVTDGDPTCAGQASSCITVQCPSTVRINICPLLFFINPVPRTIPPGETKTVVETRGQDTDGLPHPLQLTLSTQWGSFENTENNEQSDGVIAQDAIYNCDRAGPVEVCVDATDGACTKTRCDTIACPDDIPAP